MICCSWCGTTCCRPLIHGNVYVHIIHDRGMTMALYESCLDAEEAVAFSLTGRPKNKWRPIPLAAVELQKRALRFLRIGSETLMTAAEEVYQQGRISYPRTETEKFRLVDTPPNFYVITTIKIHEHHSL